jgi:acyl-CoA synthetase (AMP-forming)/AMP-acid ligase II
MSPFRAGDVELTPAALHDGAGRWASRLRRRGVRAGDRIGLLAGNSATYLQVVAAAGRLGAATVLLNPRLTPADLRFQLDDADACAVLADGPFADRVADAWLLDELEAEADDAPLADESDRDADRLFLMLYTSGTTGRAKGCMLSWRAWRSSMDNAATALALQPSDRYLARAPFFHVAGLGVAAATLAAGGIVVPSPAKGLSAHEQWALVDDHRITVASFVAPLPDVAAAAPRSSPLRIMFGQGGRWSADVHADAAARMPRIVFAGLYGSTEAGNFATRSFGSDERERPGTIGRPLPSFDAMVVDDTDQPLAPGAAGQLLLRGPSVTSGYLIRPDATSDAFVGGGLLTGDVVRADDEGYLYLLDRVKDMVKPGGENVYCVEIERVLLTHPAVVQCAVIGVPDARWGEGVKAVVVADTPVDVEALDRWCLDRLAAFKRPRWYELVEALPQAPGGKVDKRRLRADHDEARAVRLTERDRQRCD